MKRIRGKLAIFIALVLSIGTLMTTLAACGNNNNPDDGKKPVVVAAPIVDMDVIDTYLESGKQVNLSDAVTGTYNSISVIFKVGEGEAAKVYSSQEIGFDTSSYVWTPNVRNEKVEISLTAANSTGSGYGDKNVYVVEPASVRAKSILKENVSINEEISLRSDFITYTVVQAVCDEATVTYIDDDGNIQQDNNKAQFDPATMRYTINRAGEHRVTVTIDSGVNKVTKEFYFLAQSGNDFIEIEFLDDFMGFYNDESADEAGMPEGLPKGKVAKNATLNYKLTRDLDYLDTDSWVDGVIKPWTPVVASGSANSQETDEGSVFSGTIDGLGHTISNLSNIFTGRSTEVTVTREWTEAGEQKSQEFTYPVIGEVVNQKGFAFFESEYASGTIRNLNIEYSTVLDEDNYTQYTSYAPINLTYGEYNFNSQINLLNVNADGSIEIDAGGIESQDYSPTMMVGGLVISAASITECDVNVDISVGGSRTKTLISGVSAIGRNGTVSEVNYNGDISVKINDAGYVSNGTVKNYEYYIGGVGAFWDSGVYENMTSSGKIEVNNKYDEELNSTARITVGSIAGSSIGTCYYSSSDMDISIDNLVNSFSPVGGLFGISNTVLYGCSYSGDLSIDNYDAVDGGVFASLSGSGAVGGIAGNAQKQIYDCTFNGSITLKGDGYKAIGGITGNDLFSYSSSSEQYYSGNNASGQITVDGGKLLLGGIVAKAVPGMGVSVYIQGNLYNSKLEIKDVESRSIASGVIGAYQGLSSSATSLTISDNDVYGTLPEDISDLTSYLLLGKMAIGNAFNNGDGTFTAYFNETDGVAKLNSISTSKFKYSSKDFGLSLISNRNSESYSENICWAGGVSPDDKAALEERYADYIAAIADRNCYVEIKDGEESKYSLFTEEKGFSRVVKDGKTYLVIPYRVYTQEESADYATEYFSNYNGYNVITEENMTESAELFRSSLDKIYLLAESYATIQDKVAG